MHYQSCAKWIIALALIVPMAVSNLSAPALAADKIKFALPGNSMGYLPLFVAVHRGFFKDEGIDIELPRLIPAMAQNALMSGDVQYHGLADSGLRLAARGAPIKAIFYGADRPMYYLVAQKEIRSVAELKGKRVGVSQFGGTSDLSARLALKHFGVEPERDALIIQIGSEGTRMAALRAGSVAAIIVPVPAVVAAEAGRLQRNFFRRRCGRVREQRLHARRISASRRIHRRSRKLCGQSTAASVSPRKIPKEPSG